MDRLPFEILDYILSLATYSPVRYVINNPPSFEYLDIKRADDQTIAALRIKCTLVLVCTTWRALARKYLFEEILIRNQKSDAILADTLEASVSATNNSTPLGSHVKRIIFRRSINSPSRKSGLKLGRLALRIVKCCPNVRFISHDRDLLDPVPKECARDYKDPYNFAELSKLWCATKTSIQRLDYTLGNVSLDEHAFNVSPTIFYNFTSLQVLSISTDVPAWAHKQTESNTHAICLPNVHTLRLFRPHMRGLHWDEYTFRAIDLPALQRLSVADLPTYQYIGLVQRNAPKIRVFEISISPPEMNRNIDMVELDGGLLYCPNLEEFHFPVLVSGYIDNIGCHWGHSATFRMPPIRHVGLHAVPWRRLEQSKGKLGTVRFRSQNYDQWRWEKLRRQFDMLISLIPSLDSITLYGVEWTEYILNDQFKDIIKKVSDAGVVLRGDLQEVNVMVSSVPQSKA